MITGVFFDSGGTLATPTGDGWWPKPRFAELLMAAGLPVPDDDAARKALDAGAAHLARHQVLATLDEEVAVYAGFYEIVLNRLFGEAPPDLVQPLAEAAVYDLDQRPFEDTVPALDSLAAAGIRLGVVSNAGPSIELRHRDMGLRHYFDVFVVSAVVGVEKPDHRIYEIALERAGMEPGEVVFVDDVAENVDAAARLGMRAYLIDREVGREPPGSAHPAGLPLLTDLTDLPSVITSSPPSGSGADMTTGR